MRPGDGRAAQRSDHRYDAVSRESDGESTTELQPVHRKRWSSRAKSPCLQHGSLEDSTAAGPGPIAMVRIILSPSAFLFAAATRTWDEKAVPSHSRSGTMCRIKETGSRPKRGDRHEAW
jgi:hypothetical protein